MPGDPLLEDTYGSGYKVVASTVAQELRSRINRSYLGVQAVDAFGDGWDTGMEGAIEIIDEFIKEISVR